MGLGNLLVHLDDVAFRIMKKYLVPLGSESGAVVGKGDPVIAKMLLECLYIVRAEGDVAAVHRIDMPTIPRRDIQIPLGKMHLHATFGGEFDFPVIPGLPGGVRAWKILRRDLIHLQDIDVEIMQGVDVPGDVVDMVELEFQDDDSIGRLIAHFHISCTKKRAPSTSIRCHQQSMLQRFYGGLVAEEKSRLNVRHIIC